MSRVVITGANRGYGLALAQTCVARGDQVIATCRNPAEAPELSELATQHDNCTVLAMDVTDEGSIAAVVTHCEEKFGAIDLLLNNAGRMGGDNLLTANAEQLLGQFHVNAVGVLFVSRAFAGLLEQGEQPTIVVSSSSWGSLTYKGDPTHGANDKCFGYCTSKAAANMIMRGLSFALKPQGIAVFAIHPGGRGDPGGGPTREESAIATLELAAQHGNSYDSGKYYHWRGYELPW